MSFASRGRIANEQARNTHDRGLLAINRAWVFLFQNIHSSSAVSIALLGM